MRLLLVVALVLLGIGLVWWLDASRTHPGTPLQHEPIGGATGSERAGESGSAPLAGGASPATSPERVEAPAGAVSGPAADGDVRIRVLDERTREPVAAAELWWSDATVAELAKLSAEEIRRGQQDEEPFLQQHGRRATSDAQGRAIIHPLVQYRIVGRLDTRYGHASGVVRDPEPGDAGFPGEVLLLLAPDQTLIVHTIDAQRRPVGSVTVNVAFEQAKGGRIVRKLGVTDTGGVLDCRHAQLLLGRDVPVVRTQLLASITGAETAEVPIDLRAVPKTPVELVVPACGIVELLLLGFDGKPWPHTIANVRVRIGQGMHDAVPFGPDGKAEFPGVLCGKRFVATGSPWFADQPFAGPLQNGERTAVTLHMEPGLRVLTGRLVTSDGRPYTELASIRIAGRAGGTWSLRRDDDGRFFFPLDPQLGDRPVITIVGDETNNTREAVVVLRGPLVPGLDDAGDVVLDESPVLVSGELVFADGDAAPAGIRLALQRRDEGERTAWRAAGGRVIVDEQNRFAVRAPAGGSRWRLIVRGDCAPVPPIEFEPGTTDLRVPIDRPSSVVATFLPDPTLQHMSVRLIAQNAAPLDRVEQALRRGTEQAELREDGDRLRAEWPSLGAGPHRLVVECAGQEPVLDLAIDVPKGARANDPRLADIDLRGRVRLVRVQLTESDGKPFAGAADIVVRGIDEPGARWLGRRYEAGTDEGIELVLSRPADLLVVPIGRRGALASAVFADARIALAPAPKLTLVWADAPALQDGVVAQLTWGVADWPANGPIVHLTHARGSVTGASVLLGEGLPARLTGGRASGVCSAVMPMRPRIQLRRPGRPSQGVDVTPAVIDPSKLGDGEVIEVRADAASLAKALAVING